MQKSIFRISSFALLTLAFGMLQAQAKSDFSGTWKGNNSKSDFGPMPAPDTFVEKIAHEDPSLKVHTAQTGGSGDQTYDMTYTTDGKECLNHMGGTDNTIKTSLKWDGDDLVADSTGSYDGNDFTAKDRWTLSDAGKTLTVTRHVSAGGADFDIKMVLEKQ
jgi:hypothetical protein